MLLSIYIYTLCFFSFDFPIKHTLKPSETITNSLIRTAKEEKGPCQIRTDLTGPLERENGGTNQVNDIIRGDIRWPEFELWNYVGRKRRNY